MSKVIKEILIVGVILSAVVVGFLFLQDKKDDDILKKIDSMKADEVKIEIREDEAYLNDLNSEEKGDLIEMLHSISKKEIKRVTESKMMDPPTGAFRVEAQYENAGYLFELGYYDSENVVLKHDSTHWKIYNEELGKYLIDKKKELASKEK